MAAVVELTPEARASLCPHCGVGAVNHRWASVSSDAPSVTLGVAAASFGLVALVVGALSALLIPLVLVTIVPAVVFIPLGLLSLAFALLVGIAALAGRQVVRCTICERFSWGRTQRFRETPEGVAAAEGGLVARQALRDLTPSLPRRARAGDAAGVEARAVKRAAALRTTKAVLKWTLIILTVPWSLAALAGIWIWRRYRAPNPA